MVKKKKKTENMTVQDMIDRIILWWCWWCWCLHTVCQSWGWLWRWRSSGLPPCLLYTFQTLCACCQAKAVEEQEAHGQSKSQVRHLKHGMEWNLSRWSLYLKSCFVRPGWQLQLYSQDRPCRTVRKYGYISMWQHCSMIYLISKTKVILSFFI